MLSSAFRADLALFARQRASSHSRLVEVTSFMLIYALPIFCTRAEQQQLSYVLCRITYLCVKGPGVAVRLKFLGC